MKTETESGEAALRAHATAQGISEEGYVRRILERDLAAPGAEKTAGQIEAPGTHQPQRAAEIIRELRKGNILPEGFAIRDLIDQGRA